jgi:hypothetical protein
MPQVAPVTFATGGDPHGDLQMVAEMLLGFDRDSGSVKKYVDSVAGTSGIYVGGGDMPDGCVLQIILDDEDEPDEPVSTKYTVTYHLTNCESREGGVNGEVVEGSEYQDWITAAEGFTLDTLTVTMGGAAVPVSDGIFTITNVTGNIVITATATATGESYDVAYTYDENAVTISERYDQVVSGGDLVVRFVAQNGYTIESITVTMSGITETATKGNLYTKCFFCGVTAEGSAAVTQILYGEDMPDWGKGVTGDVSITVVTKSV